ncbi:MAG: AAA family ATPase [Deltaproteobacteria bacterium]|nr:AAA family ATPase [Deltaproteobacteria bacterium]
MDRVVIGSTSRGAGKTSVVIGLGKVLGGRLAYRKPFGDRLVYRRKVARDYDSVLLTGVFGLAGPPEETTIGFEHSKLRYMYDEEGRKARLRQMVPPDEAEAGPLVVEAGYDLTCGASVHLDAVSLARYLGARLVLVVAGAESAALDEIAFVKKYVATREATLAGVVVNKVRDPDAFRETWVPEIEKWGVKVLGVVPYREELTHPSVGYVADRLFAKVLTGEANVGRPVKNVFIGAMSADSALRSGLFKHPGKMIITGGDRTDMVLAALEGDTACVVLTNNVVPPANIVARAAEHGVPLLLVSQDTYQVAAQVDNLEPLLVANETAKIELLGKIVGESVKVKELVSGS